MTDNENKNWAFLSYSQQDNRAQRSETPAADSVGWGDWLHAALKLFSIPAEFIGQINGRGEIIPERIEPIFQDESERPDDATLSAETRTALEQSRCLIVICSPRSAKSLQVNEVVRYFKQLGRGNNILPIVIAGEPNASEGNQPGRAPDDECFVPALRHPLRADGTLDVNRRAGKSIFVDARHGVEKREILAQDNRHAEADLEMAKIQLIALLIGVGFNGLWWREQKRHFFDFAEAQHQARAALNQVEEVQRQLQEAQRQTRAAQSQALENQNLPREVHGQIQAAQDQALAAQNQAHEAQQQLSEFQTKVRETQIQLEEVRHRALAAEGKVLEAQTQAREIQNQLEEARNEARVAQNKILEVPSLPPENPSRIQQLQEAQNHVLAAQSEVQKTQSELEDIRQEAQVARNKFLAAQSEVSELQNHARSAQSQLVAARDEVRAAQSKVAVAEQQARDAQNKIQEIQNQTRDAQSRIDTARQQVEKSQNQSRTARRLNKVFAVLAVLALLAAVLVAQKVRQQRQLADQTLAKATAEASGKFDVAAGGLNQEQIREALEKIDGAAPDGNRRHSLDELAAAIPRAEIPEALKTSSVIVNDSHRSYFQLAVLDHWMQADSLDAFRWVCELADTDFRQRALEKILPVLSRSSGAEPVAALNQVVTNWARKEPQAAIQFASQRPELFSAALGEMIEAWFQNNWNAAMSEINRLETLPENIAPWPWTKFLLNATVVRPLMVPVETETLSDPTNAPIEIKAHE